ncbi:UDP-N-acetylenolpyruvoylglucosamine reductase [Aquimarina algiphila]|uniref:UDP-N-acetylenolpyruvoylglucosamine reductase n=1 Tax=Aquimarina algiphila TaxID=2047982 RepID=A0A554VEX6_9FLAO|nr:UDP-N-acetylenolpyruvoylglucosamine reductase [Aquimarina algiphila]
MYIKGTSKVVIADDLFVTKQFDEILEIDYFRAVINDSKLSKGSPWTPNQKSELIDVFKNNPNKKYIKFEVRSTKGELNKFDLPDESFVQGVEIRIYREDVFKIISDGNDSFGEVLDMNKLNFK